MVWNIIYSFDKSLTKKLKIMKTLKAKINTKSNFRNLNGFTLDVVEISGTRVSCIYFDRINYITIDFTLQEVELIY